MCVSTFCCHHQHDQCCISVVLNNLTVMHRDLILTPPNTAGMSWKADCEPGLTTSMLELNTIVTDWEQVSLCSQIPHSLGKTIQEERRLLWQHVNACAFAKT